MQAPYLKILLAVIIPAALLLSGACYFSDNALLSQPEGLSGADRILSRLTDAEPVITEEGFSVYN